MSKTYFFTDHGTYITGIVYISSLFIWYISGQTALLFLAITSPMAAIFFKICQSKGKLYVDKNNEAAQEYFKHTSLAFGYILLVGFIISIQQYHDIIYSTIRLIMFACVFQYIFFIFWQNHTLIFVERILIGFSLLTAVFSLIEIIHIAALPPMLNYIDFMAAANVDDHTVAGLVREGKISAFGIFRDGFTNGMVMAIAETVVCANILFEKRNIIPNILLMVILLVGIYFTESRNCYLSVITGKVSLILIKLIHNKGHTYPKFIAAFWLLICAIIMSWTVMHYYNSNEIVIENDSVSSRVYSWSVVFDKYIMHGNIFNIAFGYGISQWGGIYQDEDLWALDNIFVQIFMYSGFIGVLAYIYWWFRMSAMLLRIAISSMDYLCIATYTVFNQFLLVGIFNATLFVAPATPIILILGYLACYKFDTLPKNVGFKFKNNYIL